MPPSILSDAVQQVVDKLANKRGIHISVPVQEQAREQLRILAARVTVGRLGVTDRAERRAAVVLEYACRQQRQTGSSSSSDGPTTTAAVRLSLKDLAAITGVKLVQFELLHKTIGNYLQNNSSAALQRRGGVASRSSIPTTKRAAGATATVATMSSNNRQARDLTQAAQDTNHKRRKLRSADERPNRIPDLALRLAAFTADPYGFARSAVTLLKDLETHVQALPSVHERRGHLYDMTRYRAAYEAACFYHIVTRHSSVGGNNAATKHRSNTAAAAAAQDEGPQQQRPLELADLVEASTEFTFLEIKQVLPHVKEMADKIQDERAQKRSLAVIGGAAAAPSKMTPSPPQRNIATTTTATGTSNSRIQKDRGDVGDTETVAPPRTEAEQWQDDLRSFDEWKQEMLVQALEQAQRDLVSGQVEGLLDETFADAANEYTREQALVRAADTVLQKYGLLVNIGAVAVAASL